MENAKIASELLKLAKSLVGQKDLDVRKVKAIRKKVIEARNAISNLKGEISKSEINKLDSVMKQLDKAAEGLYYFI